MARKSDGTVIIDTRMSTDGFSKGVGAMQKQVGGLNGTISKLGKTIAVAFAVGKLFQFGKEAIDLGSDLQEVQNVVDVTFTTMSDKVNEFAKNAAESAGLSETMAKRYAGTFGAMAKAFGFAEEESFGMATALTQLSGDVASFYNLTQDEAYTKLKSVFTGETETLKDLGVVMTQNALDSYAMANGYGKTTQAMTEQEKVALRYAFVQDQLSAASGDFIRTQDSWANQTRILNLNFDSFKANIGQALINVFTPFLQVINQIVAKLAELSSRFLSFTQLITGRGSSGGGSPGTALEDIASGYGDVEEATKAAEKAQKSYTSGLDELNIVSKDSGGGAASGGGIGSPIIPSEAIEGNEALMHTSDVLDRIKERLLELAGLFKQGFFDGFGDFESRFQTIRDSIDSIKKSFSNIFDADVAKSFNKLVNEIVKTLGKIIGSIASIYLTVGANIIGGIAKYLEDNTGRIKGYLIEMFDIRAEISEQVGDWFVAIADIFEVFAGEDAQQITADIIGIFAETFMSISELFAKFSLDLTSLYTQPIIDSKEEIKSSLQELVSGFSAITGFIQGLFADVGKIINEVYDKYISPILTLITQKITEFVQNRIAPILSDFGGLFQSIGEALTALWQNILEPIVQWLMDHVLPVVALVAEYIIENVFSTFEYISLRIENLIEMFTGLIDFLTGVFTGDWQKAWEGIKKMFSAIWESFAVIVKNVVNKIVDILNFFLGIVETVQHRLADALSFSIDIPDWVPGIGGKSFHLDVPKVTIPKVPYLATGAVIPPNAPFMAMLGDQRHGMNLEAPEDLIRQIVREEAGASAEMMALLSEIAQNTRETADKDLTIGDRDIARANIRGKQSIGYSSLITVG